MVNSGRSSLTWMIFAGVVALLLAFCFGLILDQLRYRARGSLATPAAIVPDRRSEGERAVDRARNRLAVAPDDPQGTISLVQAYLLRARETADPAYYGRADVLLQKALAERPNDLEAMLAAGSLALSRHEFAAGLEWGRRAVAQAPLTAAGYGVMADALLELGRYEEAVQATQRMVDLRPDLASYSRVSYLRELHGDLAGAIEGMQLAVQAGAPTGEATAWAEVQLGNLLFARGDLTGAERAYEGSVRRVDGYVYGQAGLARIQAARGDLVGAAARYERVAQALPLPELVIALGDTYARLGQDDRARQQHELVAAMQQLFAANGVRTELELALFAADHDGDLDQAWQAARAEYALRPSVQVADALAWIEYRRGDLAGALEHSRAALRLGSRDPLMLYRAGVIAQANGELERAYDLLRSSSDLNPEFSIARAGDLAARLRQLGEQRGRP